MEALDRIENQFGPVTKFIISFWKVHKNEIEKLKKLIESFIAIILLIWGEI